MRRAVEIWGDSGPRVLFWKVLGQTVFRRMRYLERPLWDPIPPASPIPGVTVGELPPDRWRDLRQFRPGTDAEEITRRLRGGERCFIACSQGRIIYAGWVAAERAWFEVLGTKIPLAQGAVYFYESFTIPEMRGCGTAPEVGNFCLRSLRQAGFQSVVAVVDAENQSGFRALEKNGYHPAGWLALLRFGPWRRFIRWKGSHEPHHAPPSADSS